MSTYTSPSDYDEKYDDVPMPYTVNDMDKADAINNLNKALEEAAKFIGDEGVKEQVKKFLLPF